MRYLAVLLCACSSITYRVNVEPAATSAATASVFGVFNNGRMDPDFWDYVAKDLSAAFAGGTCETLWGDRLREQRPEDFARIGKESRENGATPAIIGPLMPLATGDLIVVFNASGHVRARDAAKDEPRDRTSAANNARGAGMRGSGMRSGGGGFGGGFGRGGGGMNNAARPPGTPTFTSTDVETSVYRSMDLSAEIYTQKDHTFVASVGLHYTGEDLREATAAFAKKMHEVLPALRCSGWALGASSQPASAPQP